MADRLEHLQLPVLRRDPRYPVRLSSGSCVVCASADRQEVLKSAFTFDLSSCDAEIRKEYEAFARESQEMLEREKEIYKHLGPHRNLLTVLNIKEEGLVLPFMKNGNLRDYIASSHHTIPQQLRILWITEALQVIEFIHSKSVLQADLSTRNFLVADDLRLLLCDFSGSALGDKESMVSPETRYARISEGRTAFVSVDTEIFAIGSLVYEIMTRTKPYEDLTEEEIERHYDQGRFPSTEHFHFGHIVKKCWEGNFKTVNEILQEIEQSDRGLSEDRPQDITTGL